MESFTAESLRRLAASSDLLVSQLAVALIEAKAEVAACCERIKKLGGRPSY